MSRGKIERDKELGSPFSETLHLEWDTDTWWVPVEGYKLMSV